jgi:antitoxin component of MazEF toxin-antitoxin module
MTLVVKSSDENIISLPARLMTVLNLREGEAIKAIVEGETLRLARLSSFLSLRGVLADDDGFDRALEFIDRAWQSWTIPTSA